MSEIPPPEADSTQQTGTPPETALNLDTVPASETDQVTAAPQAQEYSRDEPYVTNNGASIFTEDGNTVVVDRVGSETRIVGDNTETVVDLCTLFPNVF